MYKKVAYPRIYRDDKVSTNSIPGQGAMSCVCSIEETEMEYLRKMLTPYSGGDNARSRMVRIGVVFQKHPCWIKWGVPVGVRALT